MPGKSIPAMYRTCRQAASHTCVKGIIPKNNNTASKIEQEKEQISSSSPKDNKEETAYNLFNNPMFLSNLNRIGITIYAFFAISIVVAIYRYSMRLGAHYEACADAIELSEGVIESDFNQLIQSLSPGKIGFGKVDSPVDRAIDALQSAFRAGKSA